MSRVGAEDELGPTHSTITNQERRLNLSRSLSRIPFLYNACVYGKATRSVIPRLRSSGRASQMLELVHSDMCGPLQVQSIGGARYFITFIDDHSNWSVVYPMHKKSEAFHYYKLFAYYAQTHTGRKIKILRSDPRSSFAYCDFYHFPIFNASFMQFTEICTVKILSSYSASPGVRHIERVATSPTCTSLTCTLSFSIALGLTTPMYATPKVYSNRSILAQRGRGQQHELVFRTNPRFSIDLSCSVYWGTAAWLPCHQLSQRFYPFLIR